MNVRTTFLVSSFTYQRNRMKFLDICQMKFHLHSFVHTLFQFISQTSNSFRRLIIMKLELESKLVVSMSVKELLVCVKSKKIEEETLGKCYLHIINTSVSLYTLSLVVMKWTSIILLYKLLKYWKWKRLLNIYI
jgi:hypothetical protein